MNQTIKDILERRSTRSYENKPVAAKDLEMIIECAKFAPSARGLQPWHFTVITNRDVLDRITAMNREIMKESAIEPLRKNADDPEYDSFRGAPHAIIISGDDNAKFASADCANATQNMAIAAQSLGLSTCYIASFIFAFEGEYGAKLCSELGIPDGYTPMYALSVGHGNETIGERVPRCENIVNYVR